jgi:hypothetical protein
MTNDEKLDWIESDIMTACASWMNTQRVPLANAALAIQQSLKVMGPVPGGAKLCEELKFALRHLETAQRLIDEAVTKASPAGLDPPR